MGNGARPLFNPFRLDTPNQSLKGGTEKIFLKPKTIHLDTKNQEQAIVGPEYFPVRTV
jgi:hypothetical protein